MNNHISKYLNHHRFVVGTCLVSVYIRYLIIHDYIKNTHDVQLAELRDSQAAEVVKVSDQHQEFLDEAKKKFDRERARYDS